MWKSRRSGLVAKRRRAVGFGPGLGSFEDRTVLSFFTEPTTALGITAAAQALGDFNADGKVDMIAVSQGASTANLYLDNGDGTFALRSPDATGTGAGAVAVGHLNGDGKLGFADHHDRGLDQQRHPRDFHHEPGEEVTRPRAGRAGDEGASLPSSRRVLVF